MLAPLTLFEDGDRCLALAHVNYLNFVFSLFILIGILLSYLPQHIRLVRLRTSFGLSPYFVLLGATGGTCQFANILVLPSSTSDIACCSSISGFACFAGLLGVLQVGTQWACFIVIVVLFLVYFPRATVADPHLLMRADTEEVEEEQPSYRTAKAVVWIVAVHALVTAAVSVGVSVKRPELLQGWANVLGILSTGLACVQYLPQIWTTYVLKRAASLSIAMMCIQTPGSFVWAASLAGRLGASGWSAWGVYMVTGLLQGVLLVLAIVYEMRVKREFAMEVAVEGEERRREMEREEEGESGGGGRDRVVGNERTPLLGEGG